jgi:hypothetical protein
VVDRHITEDIVVPIGNPSTQGNFTITDVGYNIAINGQPFFLANTDERPYRRVTAKYRKDQVDQTTEPGEQTLTGWWIRSQSSFHRGAGIKFYDPSVGDEVDYRFDESKGCNVWTQGEVTLLRQSTSIGLTPTPLETNGRAVQRFEAIEWISGGVKYEGFLYGDSYIIVKVDEAGAQTNFQTYVPATDDRIYSLTNDGKTAFWVTNAVSGGLKLTMYKKSLDDDSSDSPTQMFQENGLVVTNAVLEYTKERIVAGINNEIYEISPTATALPTAVYTHPNANHIWTSVTSSGPAIYVAGYQGINSSIIKFTLSNLGVMPTLTSAITAAEMPVGEIIYKIKYYLGYMIIGTNKGVRVAVVSDEDGSISYGPLLFESEQPVYDFATRDKYVWCASGQTDGDPGLIRIDLGSQIKPLVFAYANDVFHTNGSSTPTVACDFIGDTDRLAWVTAAAQPFSINNKELTSNVAILTTTVAHNYVVGDKVFVSGVGSPFDSSLAIGSEKTITAVTSTTFSYAETNADISSTAVSPVGSVVKAGVGFTESATVKVSEGFIKTGRIRYNTLEPKLYKLLRPRIDLTYGSLNVITINKSGTESPAGTFSQGSTVEESATPYPIGPQELLTYKFIFNRSSTNTTQGPVFNGYQVKALPATLRQRIIQFPVFCYDQEADPLGNQVGYEDRAFDRLIALELIEANGDTVKVQDFRTNETFIATIEELDFMSMTPPGQRFNGFGGLLTITVRTV